VEKKHASASPEPSMAERLSSRTPGIDNGRTNGKKKEKKNGSHSRDVKQKRIGFLLFAKRNAG